MSIARHHAEWLSLVDLSGPFLSVPVLLRAFPQGLDKLDSAITSDLRLAYDEWLQEQRDPAIHTAWVRYVLTSLLEFPVELIKEGQSLPPGLRASISEHGEVLRPDLAIIQSDGEPENSTPKLLLQVYQPSQKLESAVAGKQWKASPATRMMELLHATEIPLGIVTNGEQWMLVFAPKNETTGYASWYASLWMDEPTTLRAFASLLSVRRFFGVADNDTLLALLNESSKNQQEVTDQLGLQVRQAVEVLVQSFDRLDQDSGRTLLKGVDEKKLYEASLTVMMRLVFLFSAEERKLMPIDEYALYAQYYAVSNMGAQLRETADKHGEEILERSFDAWSRLLATFRAVYAGVEHDAMRLPPYGGNLFDPDRFKFLEGRPSHGTWRDTEAEPPRIDNRTVLHLLESLQWLEVRLPGGGAKEKRRLSFRALDIEQIGHVYEGLLDHTAVRTEEPVLGLFGAKDKEPEIPLRTIEKHYQSGVETLVEFLKEETGRSEKALRKCITEPGLIDEAKLRVSCRNDASLMARVHPFAALVREDTFGYPVVIAEGSVYVTSGTDRRSSGTHYTPRSLTEPIVQHTLEPLVYVGPAEGKPKEEWKLKSARELLDLKICDMAMGSGAFLVQACRYLSERILEAWDTAQKELGDNLQITPEGERAKGTPEERLVPVDEDERRAIAMRIVAERCLYGVDKNPLAVEMAKLSLWLITLSKGKPFTFLNHALKCGDSLVGADERVFLNWARDSKSSQITIFDQKLQLQLDTARSKRMELESFEAKDVRDAERKADLCEDAELAMNWVKHGCDLIIGTLLQDLSPAERRTQLSEFISIYLRDSVVTTNNARKALEAAQRVRAFHWPFEFPEIFQRGGFDGIIGNPPFMGGTRISSNLGSHVLSYLVANYSNTGDRTDLVAYFVRRMAANLRETGNMGFIGPTALTEGDTRNASLNHLISEGCTVFRGRTPFGWPGTAMTRVVLCWIHQGMWDGELYIDDQKTQSISNTLSNDIDISAARTISSHPFVAGMGSKPYGKGFVLSTDEATLLLARNSRLSDCMFPYFVGADINAASPPEQLRWIINFHEWDLEVAETYEECMRIVREKVYPERIKDSDRTRRTYWWRFERHAKLVIEHLSGKRFCFGRSTVSASHIVIQLEIGPVYSANVVVFCTDKWEDFAVLQSSLHTVWLEARAATMPSRNDPMYVPSVCLETYPWPHLTKSSREELAVTGEEFNMLRSRAWRESGLGPSAFQHVLNNPQATDKLVTQVREALEAMDRSVMQGYDWGDIQFRHGFFNTDRGIRFGVSDEVRQQFLTRLFELNLQIYSEKYEADGRSKKAETAISKRKNRKPQTHGNTELPL